MIAAIEGLTMPDPISGVTAARRPDAVKIPVAHPTRRGHRGRRFDYLFDLAEEILGADPTRGENAGRRHQVVEGVYFFALDHSATLLFAHDHPLAGRPRYHWVVQADGCVYGYMTDDARADLESAKG